jgi:hypothetical protein
MWEGESVSSFVSELGWMPPLVLSSMKLEGQGEGWSLWLPVLPTSSSSDELQQQCLFPFDLCHVVKENRLLPIIHTILVVSGICLALHRRAQRKWKKALRDERLQRLNRQEEALRHKILHRTAELQRDCLKRKIRYLQTDKDVLERQVEELQSQRQDLYEFISMSRKDLNVGVVDLDSMEEETVTETSTGILLTTPTFFFEPSSNAVSCEEDVSDCDERTIAPINIQGKLRKLDFLSSGTLRVSCGDDCESITSRSTYAAEPLSPASAVKAKVKCMKLVG